MKQFNYFKLTCMSVLPHHIKESELLSHINEKDIITDYALIIKLSIPGMCEEGRSINRIPHTCEKVSIATQ